MIDGLQRVALKLQFLRLPSVALGLFFLASAAFVVLGAETHHSEQFLIPSLIGVLWAMSAFSFIVTFRSVPEKADSTQAFFTRLWRGVSRGWYWLVGVSFVVTTVAAAYVTNRLLTVWLSDFGS